LSAAHTQSDVRKQAQAMIGVRMQTEKLRGLIDEIEIKVASDLWPVPKYADMIVGL
jgi:glutamine synthetase type III